MDLTKAIQMWENDVAFGDILQQVGLSFSQMYMLDIGLRAGKTKEELESKINLVNDDMKSQEIKKILEQEK